MDWPSILLAAFAVTLIGVSKAGFGGGLGMLTTPLCVLAFGPRDAIGVLLPLLCAGDAFSIRHYWGKWSKRSVSLVLPGVVVGVLIGVQLIGRFSPRQLNIVIGALAVGFVIFQLARERILRAGGTFRPGHLLALPFGLGIGITSTFAHGAGPVAALYLVPQRLAKEIFVGTHVLLFTWVNWIKMPFFVIDRALIDLPVFAPEALIRGDTLLKSALLVPLIPAGVRLGVWLNRRVSEALFSRLIYLFTLLTGLQLIFNFNPAGWFS
jgi:hypothetical protein